MNEYNAAFEEYCCRYPIECFGKHTANMRFVNFGSLCKEYGNFSFCFLTAWQLLESIFITKKRHARLLFFC